MRLCSYARKCRSGKIRILAYFTQRVTIFSIAAVECFTGTSTFLNSIQDGGEGGGGQKASPYQFLPCHFYKRRNYGAKLSDFFSFNSFATLV